MMTNVDINLTPDMKSEDFDYNSIEAGYYDRVFHKRAGIQSKWHHLKFAPIRDRIGAIVRRSAVEPELAVSAYALPSEVVTERIPYHLSSLRLTPLGGGVLTGFGDELLVADAKVDGTVPPRTMKCPHEGRVEAIARNASGDLVVTGGHDGSVCIWEASGASDGLPALRVVSTLSGGPDTAKRSQPSGTHVYDGVSITAACFLGEDNNFATTDAS